tara:strand:- start:181 stop:504 length:324 start_codon:yes stop_codon:yes gene_type:complete
VLARNKFKYCSQLSECEVDDLDVSGDDEELITEISIDLCMDEFEDALEIAELSGCKAETRDYINCYTKNAPVYSCYDDWEDYEKDYSEYREELCWQEIEKYNSCEIF